MEKFANQGGFDGRTFFATRAYGAKIADLPPPPDEKGWDTLLDWCFRDAASTYSDDHLLIPQMKQAIPLVWEELGKLVPQLEARCDALHLLFHYVANRYQPDGTQRKKAFGFLDGTLFSKSHPNPSERVGILVDSVSLYYRSVLRSGLCLISKR